VFQHQLPPAQLKANGIKPGWYSDARDHSAGFHLAESIPPHGPGDNGPVPFDGQCISSATNRYSLAENGTPKWASSSVMTFILMPNARAEAGPIKDIQLEQRDNPAAASSTHVGEFIFSSNP
jgi:hypothetical protein